MGGVGGSSKGGDGSGLALRVVFKRSAPGLASVGNVAAALQAAASLVALPPRVVLGPLQAAPAHSVGVGALAVVQGSSSPVVVSGGYDGAIRSWPLDGTAAPLSIDAALIGQIGALAVIDDGAQPLIVAGGDTGALRSWHLDNSPGPLRVDGAHASGGGGVWGLAATEAQAAPLVISAGGDGALRSWHLDGSPGPLSVDGAHAHGIGGLTVLADQGAPLIITGGGDGALRSWHLDGTPGALNVPQAHNGMIHDLAVGPGPAPVILSGGADRVIRGWRLDGTAEAAFASPYNQVVTSVAVVEQLHAPLIVGGYEFGLLFSWWWDGQLGYLDVASPPPLGPVSAIAVIPEPTQALVVAACGTSLCSWHIADWYVPPLGTSQFELHVHNMTLASPLEIVLELPDGLRQTRSSLARVLAAIRHNTGCETRVKLHGHRPTAADLDAEAAKLAAHLQGAGAPRPEHDTPTLLRNHSWTVSEVELHDIPRQTAGR